MGSHSNGSPLRQRAMVQHDDPRQEAQALPNRRRHPSRLPHPRRRRPPRRHPHRHLRRAPPLRPLPPRHQLPGSHLRRLRRGPDPQADRRRPVRGGVERRGHVHHLCGDQPGGPAEDVGGGAGGRRRRRSRRRGLCVVG